MIFVLGTAHLQEMNCWCEKSEIVFQYQRPAVSPHRVKDHKESSQDKARRVEGGPVGLALALALAEAPTILTCLASAHRYVRVSVLIPRCPRTDRNGQNHGDLGGLRDPSPVFQFYGSLAVGHRAEFETCQEGVPMDSKDGKWEIESCVG